MKLLRSCKDFTCYENLTITDRQKGSHQNIINSSRENLYKADNIFSLNLKNNSENFIKSQFVDRCEDLSDLDFNDNDLRNINRQRHMLQDQNNLYVFLIINTLLDQQ